MVLAGEWEIPARSLRSRRNDVCSRIREGEKMGGKGRRSVAGYLFSAAHLFPLWPRIRQTIPRCAASSGTSSYTGVSARTQTAPCPHECACAFGPGGHSSVSPTRCLAHQPQPHTALPEVAWCGVIGISCLRHGRMDDADDAKRPSPYPEKMYLCIVVNNRV